MSATSEHRSNDFKNFPHWSFAVNNSSVERGVGASSVVEIDVGVSTTLVGSADEVPNIFDEDLLDPQPVKNSPAKTPAAQKMILIRPVGLITNVGMKETVTAELQLPLIPNQLADHALVEYWAMMPIDRNYIFIYLRRRRESKSKENVSLLPDWL